MDYGRGRSGGGQAGHAQRAAMQQPPARAASPTYFSISSVMDAMQTEQPAPATLPAAGGDQRTWLPQRPTVGVRSGGMPRGTLAPQYRHDGGGPPLGVAGGGGGASPRDPALPSPTMVNEVMHPGSVRPREMDMLQAMLASGAHAVRDVPAAGLSAELAHQRGSALARGDCHPQPAPAAMGRRDRGALDAAPPLLNGMASDQLRAYDVGYDRPGDYAAACDDFRHLHHRQGHGAAAGFMESAALPGVAPLGSLRGGNDAFDQQQQQLHAQLRDLTRTPPLDAQPWGRASPDFGAAPAAAPMQVDAVIDGAAGTMLTESVRRLMERQDMSQEQKLQMLSRAPPPLQAAVLRAVQQQAALEGALSALEARVTPQEDAAWGGPAHPTAGGAAYSAYGHAPESRGLRDSHGPSRFDAAGLDQPMLQQAGWRREGPSPRGLEQRGMPGLEAQLAALDGGADARRPLSHVGCRSNDTSTSTYNTMSYGSAGAHRAPHDHPGRHDRGFHDHHGGFDRPDAFGGARADHAVEVGRRIGTAGRTSDHGGGAAQRPLPAIPGVAPNVVEAVAMLLRELKSGDPARTVHARDLLLASPALMEVAKTIVSMESAPPAAAAPSVTRAAFDDQSRVPPSARVGGFKGAAEQLDVRAAGRRRASPPPRAPTRGRGRRGARGRRRSDSDHDDFVLPPRKSTRRTASRDACSERTADGVSDDDEPEAAPPRAAPAAARTYAVKTRTRPPPDEPVVQQRAVTLDAGFEPSLRFTLRSCARLQALRTAPLPLPAPVQAAGGAEACGRPQASAPPRCEAVVKVEAAARDPTSDCAVSGGLQPLQPGGLAGSGADVEPVSTTAPPADFPSTPANEIVSPAANGPERTAAESPADTCGRPAPAHSTAPQEQPAAEQPAAARNGDASAVTLDAAADGSGQSGVETIALEGQRQSGDDACGNPALTAVKEQNGGASVAAEGRSGEAPPAFATVKADGDASEAAPAIDSSSPLGARADAGRDSACDCAGVAARCEDQGCAAQMDVDDRKASPAELAAEVKSEVGAQQGERAVRDAATLTDVHGAEADEGVGDDDEDDDEDVPTLWTAAKSKIQSDHQAAVQEGGEVLAATDAFVQLRAHFRSLGTCTLADKHQPLKSTRGRRLASKTAESEGAQYVAAKKGSMHASIQEAMRLAGRFVLRPSVIAGVGAFTREPISAREILLEYVGVLVRKVHSNKLEARYEAEGKDFYLFAVDGAEYLVDATVAGGFCRFVNHSCQPNCEVKTVLADGQRRVVLRSLRYIKPGEELSYDYRLSYDPNKAIRCRCGSANCRVWL